MGSTDVAEIRRVHADEWRQVRELRLDALRDPLAPVAFLDTYESSAARPDEFWQQRAAGAATGTRVAQLVAVASTDSTWVGTVTVLAQDVDDKDDAGRPLDEPRGLVVGVYVRPEQRGTGLIDRLLEAAADWARGQGLPRLALGVHSGNPRALGAYRRAGFTPSGVTFTSVIGPEVEMVRNL